MNKILIVLPLLAILVFSCQKEISYTDIGSGTTGGTNGVPTTSGKLLFKIVAVSGSDSNVTTYQYDGLKRLVRQTVTGTSNGFNATNDMVIVRNASGIITQVIQKNPNLVLAGTDSITKTLQYNAATKRYTYAIQPLSVSGLSFVDSTVFIYGQGNNVVEEDIYENNSGVSILTAKTEYVYSPSGNNLASEKIYSVDTSGSLSLTGTYDFSFDDKVSPLILSNAEAFAIQQELLFNTNNVVRFQFTDLATSINSFTYSATYSYNTNNNPATASTLLSRGSVVTNATYYYQ